MCTHLFFQQCYVDLVSSSFPEVSSRLESDDDLGLSSSSEMSDDDDTSFVPDTDCESDGSEIIPLPRPITRSNPLQKSQNIPCNFPVRIPLSDVSTVAQSAPIPDSISADGFAEICHPNSSGLSASLQTSKNLQDCSVTESGMKFACEKGKLNGKEESTGNSQSDKVSSTSGVKVLTTNNTGGKKVGQKVILSLLHAVNSKAAETPLSVPSQGSRSRAGALFPNSPGSAGNKTFSIGPSLPSEIKDIKNTMTIGDHRTLTTSDTSSPHSRFKERAQSKDFINWFSYFNSSYLH